jgi:hypothetical protein
MNGCAATRARRGEPEKSGFLGDYSQLQKSKEYPAALVYESPGAQWSQYDSVELDSVSLWASRSTKKLSDKDKQSLTDMLFTKLHACASTRS